MNMEIICDNLMDLSQRESINENEFISFTK